MRALPILALLILLLAHVCAQQLAAAERAPSFVFVLTDDQGYGDVGSYGASDVATPHLDTMADEGVRFTSAYAAPVCTPSRAAFLTGSHAMRVDMDRVLWTQHDRKGLNPSEVTIAEALQAQGYATAAIGKWHVGGKPDMLPPAQGFATWFGFPAGHNHGRIGYYHRLLHPDAKRPPNFGLLHLMEGNEIIELEPAPDKHTERLTNRAIEFIASVPAEQPVFLYLSHVMPHDPVVPGKAFVGTSERGTPYGDAVQELDASMGQLFAALQAADRDRDTLVVFMSDNGPAKGLNTNERGDPGPLRGMKGSTYEGGVRVPCIARWPGVITPGGVAHEAITIMDWYPTAVAMAQGTLPDVVIDGHNLMPLLSGADGWQAHEWIAHSKRGKIEAVRVGDWKFRETRVKQEPPAEPLLVTELFNLANDPGERFNLAAQHPERVQAMREQLQAIATELSETKRPAKVHPKE